MKFNLAVSLVIPVFNESETIEPLVDSIVQQSFLPAEVIFVDAGSTDDTANKAHKLTISKGFFSVLKAGRAMPGEARNIGAGHAKNEWIAFTDAGIKLDRFWLENLVKKTVENPKAGIVYGNYSPQINTFFDKAATIAFVPPLRNGVIRGKSIVSCLIKKEIWKIAGGFPDWRAAEDLIFMEKAEAVGTPFITAPEAMAMWELPAGMTATYKKFKLYSTHNVWAGRQAYWHYGVAKQYVILLISILLAFLFNYYWLLILAVWIVARTGKRIFSHRYQFGLGSLFNPALFVMVMQITLVIDMATFSGWLNAKLEK